MDALQTITSMPVTWDSIESFVARIKEEVLSGEHDPLVIEIHLKAMEETIKLLRQDAEIKEVSIKKALRYGEKKFSFHGVDMQVRDAGISYDYASTNDSEWAILDAQFKEIQEKKKAREKYLQSLPPEGAVTLQGEFINPPARSAKTTLFVTLK